MTQEEITEIISNYNKLYNLAKAKIAVLEKADPIYGTARGIIDISFGDNDVFVECDDSTQGCHDTLSFMFPISWLSKTDEELEEIVITEKNLRLGRERKKEVERLLKEKEEAEQKEFEHYQRLKEKYDTGRNS